MDYAKMSDEEFFAMIEKQYGKDWTPEELKEDPALYEEYNSRISTGV